VSVSHYRAPHFPNHIGKYPESEEAANDANGIHRVGGRRGSRLHDLGFTILHVNWPHAKYFLLHRDIWGQGSWQKAVFPPLPVISEAALKYDLRDAEALSRRELGCPVPEELRARCVAPFFSGERHDLSGWLHEAPRRVWARVLYAGTRGFCMQAPRVSVVPSIGFA
jgi:hypothetical protein